MATSFKLKRIQESFLKIFERVLGHSRRGCIGDDAQKAINSFPNDASKYDIKELIGTGATATVFAAFVELPEGEKKKIAIKKINLEEFSNCNFENLSKEVAIMNQCNHENIAKTFNSFVVDQELWITMPLMGGSLLSIIQKKLDEDDDCFYGVLEQVLIATILKEVIKGLTYLHESGHIHRDIKAGNILIGFDGTVMLGDFGLSAYIASNQKDCCKRSFVGTLCWMAPEVISSSEDGYDAKADIWSLGITIIEMVAGAPPYINFPPMKTLLMIVNNPPPTINCMELEPNQYSKYGNSFKDILNMCLMKDPCKRPTANVLRSHAFLGKAKVVEVF